MKKKKFPFGVILLLLCIMAVAGVYGYKHYMPTKEWANLDLLYDISGDETAVFLNYEKQAVRGLYKDGQIYLPVKWVNEKLNERFYWDKNEKQLVYALPDKIVYADASTEGTDGKKILLEQGEDVYLTLGLVLNYTDIRVQSYGQSEQKRVYIKTTWDPVSVATVKSDTKVRVKGGVKSPIMTEVSAGEGVTVIETMNRWTKVITSDGHIGYVMTRRLENLHEETLKSTFEAPVYKNISLDDKIVMVWHQVTMDAANAAMEQLLDSSKGVNVIAPTWFTLCDNEGNYESLASKSYVDKAHEKGIQVWAVVDNFSRECSKDVHSEELLSKTSVRKKLIERLVGESETYGFDGINLDFESLKEQAGVHYIQFIRELSVACRNKGLVLSVDNYVPASFNQFYNRKEQGIVADYVIIMGYDEHYAGGEPGSVSSISYVEQGIKDTLESVPKEKVINGVPFYTRLWTEKDGVNTSKAMGIWAAKQWIEENNVKMTWNEDFGQYYGEHGDLKEHFYLWMEEEKSLTLKMNLIEKYDLAGVAGWKLGLEDKAVWDVIEWKH